MGVLTYKSDGCPDLYPDLYQIRSLALLGGCVKSVVCVYFVCVTLLVSTPSMTIGREKSMIPPGYPRANTNKEKDDE